MASLVIELGWCGVGAARRPLLELRCGVLRVAVMHGSFLARVRLWSLALAESERALRASSAESGRRPHRPFPDSED